MVMRSRRRYRRGLLHLLSITLFGFGLMAIGCGPVKPFEPPQAGEIPNGPGLLTGSQGALVLSRDLGAKRAKTVPNDTQGGKTAAPGSVPSAPSQAPAAPDASSRKTPPL